jgi:hypothetical protein
MQQHTQVLFYVKKGQLQGFEMRWNPCGSTRYAVYNNAGTPHQTEMACLYNTAGLAT